MVAPLYSIRLRQRPTKTLSYDSCVTITIHRYCLDTRGPCNNQHYLGHVRNVYDDDDQYIQPIPVHILIDIMRFKELFIIPLIVIVTHSFMQRVACRQ